jgi:hypothetical protein
VRTPPRRDNWVYEADPQRIVTIVAAGAAGVPQFSIDIPQAFLRCKVVICADGVTQPADVRAWLRFAERVQTNRGDYKPVSDLHGKGTLELSIYDTGVIAAGLVDTDLFGLSYEFETAADQLLGDLALFSTIGMAVGDSIVVQAALHRPPDMCAADFKKLSAGFSIVANLSTALIF